MYRVLLVVIPAAAGWVDINSDHSSNHLHRIARAARVMLKWAEELDIHAELLILCQPEHQEQPVQTFDVFCPSKSL